MKRQQCKKDDYQHRNQFHCQYVAEILYALKIKQYTIENNKSACPKNKSERTVHKKAGPVVFSVSGPHTVDCGN